MVDTLSLMFRKLEESVENESEYWWRWLVRAALKCPARLGMVLTKLAIEVRTMPRYS